MLPYFKLLEIPNLKQIQDQLLDKAPEQLFKAPRVFYAVDQTVFYQVPELISALEGFGLDMKDVDFRWYVANKHYTSPIHHDSGRHDFSLNIPITNCDGTFTRFYTHETAPILRDPINLIRNDETTKTQGQWWDYKLSGCKLAAEFESTSPAIITTRSPHNITNPHSRYRVNILIRSNNNDAMKKIMWQ